MRVTVRASIWSDYACKKPRERMCKYLFYKIEFYVLIVPLAMCPGQLGGLFAESDRQTPQEIWQLWRLVEGVLCS